MNSEQLRKTLLEIVETQISEGQPPETRQTVARLIASGYSRQEAIEMVAVALAEEIWKSRKSKGHLTANTTRFCLTA